MHSPAAAKKHRDRWDGTITSTNHAHETVRVARAYLGVKWRHQGRSKKWGVDCLGFAILVGRDLGIEIEDVINYRLNKTDWPRILRALGKAGAIRIDERGIALGDLMIFDIDNQAHFGIVSDLTPLSMIHAYGLLGRVVENRFSRDWMKLRYVYRLPVGIISNGKSQISNSLPHDHEHEHEHDDEPEARS